MNKNTSESSLSEYYDLDAPPLFTPHVYVPERGEKLTFGPQGYMMRLARFMVSDFDTVRPILALAQRYNIPVTWKRVLEIFVQEAHDLEKHTGLSIHDVRCKVMVGDDIKRTRTVEYDADLTSFWNETLKFHVGDPCNIEILTYSQNKIIPNDKLGRISISPMELVERSTVTEWFPFSTKGELKLSITLSPPALAPFKFSVGYIVTAQDWLILGGTGDRVFSIMGQWPYSLSFRDINLVTVDLTIQNVVFKAREKEFELHQGGPTPKKVTILQKDTHEFHIKGLDGVDQIRSTTPEFALYSASYGCVASAKSDLKSRYLIKYSFEIRPTQDVVLILAVLFVIAKIRHSVHLR